MSSPEKKEGVPDLQLSSVFGNSVVKPQAPHLLPEDAEPRELAEFSSAETLCLSRTKLKHVSESILKNSTLKYLYLEGNQISSIPDSLFISLPNLQWLDLRNNQIVSLPAEIGLHRSLKTLLLEGNPISELPPELGNVITLKGLNLRNCPISFPPQEIVHQGLQGILQCLRSAMAKRQVSMTKAPPVELPVVEKLQLSELMGSSMEEQDEAVDEDELQRFKELKHRMNLLEKAELHSIAQGDKTPKSCLLPITKRSQEAFQSWRTQAKITQKKKMSEHKQRKNERQKKQEEAEADLKPIVEDSSDTPQRQTSMPITECEETRSARDLERQIRARVEKMQERRRNPRGTTSEQMAVAEQDVEEMRKLQMRLLERKRNRGRDLDNCFTIFTADTWPSFLDK
ncbi:leucine-rich repeat-containing protein 27-like isoform X4 [Toxotes jaculatrix]|uniref:leucine-rich repeat-containing protein 27-like isoform X4 n=1 Tax=Toxotes jaculatrix TaxID=941984 RepID=UPI001B3AA4BD|nr:leucine-rich repeat-containing protein 27-like isoform X4 [Toxotes jaculatrix]